MPIQKTPHNVRMAYAAALESAGLSYAIQSIDALLDDGYQEKFADYFPGAAAFRSFRLAFAASRKKVLQDWGWSCDAELMKKQPNSEQSIRSYFLDVFAKAVRL